MGIEDRISELSDEVDDITSLVDGLAAIMPEEGLIRLINTGKLNYRAKNRLIEQIIARACPSAHFRMIGDEVYGGDDYWSPGVVTPEVRAEVERLQVLGLKISIAGWD